MRIIELFYRPGTRTHEVLIQHGRAVAEKALAAAAAVARQQPDLDFIREAAYLHDIGIFLTDTPTLGCFGEKPYVCHGYLGREILDALGMERHALVCERHVGVGLTRKDIERQHLPLPLRDMMPVSLEEQILCYADKFFSKDRPAGQGEKSPAQIIAALMRHGAGMADRFLAWHRFFSEPA